MYYYETAHCDIRAYVYQGNIPKAATTVFNYVDCQYKCYDAEK